MTSPLSPQIFLWVLKDNDLTGMAFIDTQLYIHQMMSIKNFILAADLMKSVSLLRYQEESKTLSLVSRVRRAGPGGGGAGPPAQGRVTQTGLLLLSGNRTRSLWRSTASSSWWTTASWDSWVNSWLTPPLDKNAALTFAPSPLPSPSVRPRQEPLRLHVFT